MSNDRRPPDSTGGRLEITTGLYAVAYAAGFTGTALAIVKLAPGLRNSFDVCCSSFLIGFPVFWVAGAIETIKPLRRRWRRSLIRFGAPGWYAAGVGSVAGSVAGALFCGFNALSHGHVDIPTGVFFASAGPVAGACWILRPRRRMRRPEAADYDEGAGG